MRILLTLTVMLLLAAACTRKTNKIPEQNNGQRVSGVLKDYTGLDGCRWIIELDKPDPQGNTKLEPINLNKFSVTLKDGQRIVFGYTIQTGMASVCMAGAIAELQNAVDEN